MGEVIEPRGSWRDDPAEVLALLRELNPQRSRAAVSMYADAFADYRAAQRNIRLNGTMVAHPRTGAPIENPYLKIRETARRALLDLRAKGGLRVDPLWLDDEDEGAGAVSSEVRAFEDDDEADEIGDDEAGAA